MWNDETTNYDNIGHFYKKENGQDGMEDIYITLDDTQTYVTDPDIELYIKKV